MDIVTAFFIYLLVWWVLLFAVLPFGVRQNVDAPKGHDPGAPVHPQLKKKLLVNSVLSFVIVFVMWLLVKMEIITWGSWFREAIQIK